MFLASCCSHFSSQALLQARILVTKCSCEHLVVSRSKALDRALQTTWKVLQDEQTGLSATIEQKVSPCTPLCHQKGLKHLLCVPRMPTVWRALCPSSVLTGCSRSGLMRKVQSVQAGLNSG